MSVCKSYIHISDAMCVVVLLGVKVDFAALHECAVVAAGPERGVLLFPEICTVELQLLSTGSPDLEVLNHVFHSLLGAVHANCRNAALLYEQVRLTTCSSFHYPPLSQQLRPDEYQCLSVWSLQGGVKTILSGFYNILSQTHPSFTGLLFLLVYFCPIS